jgi:hypothetical protein
MGRGLLVEVGLKVRVVSGNEQLVIDVAEVVERLVAGKAEGLAFRVSLLAHSAPPLARHLLLVSHTTLPLIVGGLAAGLVTTTNHLFLFKF